MSTVGSIDTNHIPPVKTMKNLFVLFGLSTLLFQLFPIETISAQILSPVKQIALADNSESDYYKSGNSKYHLGDFKGAIADYDRAIKLEPSYYAYQMRAGAKSDLGDKKGAIADYDMAISLLPENATCYYERAQNKLDLGDKQGAVSDWRRAYKLYSASYNVTWANITLTKINQVAPSTQTPPSPPPSQQTPDPKKARAVLDKVHELIKDYNNKIAWGKQYASGVRQCNAVYQVLFSQETDIINLVNHNMYLFPSGSEEHTQLMNEKRLMGNKYEACNGN